MLFTTLSTINVKNFTIVTAGHAGLVSTLQELALAPGSTTRYILHSDNFIK
jgi:hypothetical protein